LFRVPRLVFVLLACTPLASHATNLTFTLGSATPSFTDGTILGGNPITTFNTAVAGNAAPFNGYNGTDVNGPSFSASWAYNYASVGGTISSATITLGLFDADSQASGNQVASFTLGGVDLTSLLNTALEGHGGANSEYDIYTITLPSSTFAALSGGTPGLSLSLQGPGLGAAGLSTTFNGAGLDFSTLSITTGTTSAAPEPGTWALLAAGIAGLVSYCRRASRV